MSASWESNIPRSDKSRSGPRVEHANDELLAKCNGERGHPQLDLAVASRGLDAPVLWTSFLGDVEACKRLDARDDRSMDDLG